MEKLVVNIETKIAWWFKYFNFLIIKLLPILHFIGFTKKELRSIFEQTIIKAVQCRTDKGIWRKLSINP